MYGYTQNSEGELGGQKSCEKLSEDRLIGLMIPRMAVFFCLKLVLMIMMFTPSQFFVFDNNQYL